MSPIDDFTFDDRLRQQIARNVTAFNDGRHDPHELTGAAVAVTIFSHEGQGAVIVTKRTPRLKDHGGQWAMPGGRIDGGENAYQASLRELHEEIGLALPDTAILGTLDDYTTRSGFVITPVVVWSDATLEDMSPNPDEVASIHAFTFDELMRRDSPNLERIPESERQVLSMNYQDNRIYAPTAAMLYQFREVALRGLKTRVSHFDQPVFAWK
ncbi:MAG: CoA pyrophosphatase [Pseudomonadales bacterium]|nr:CoA pyrophosphatase [Pseudomonadales bacterium]